MLTQRARDNIAAVVFCNLVGGQDELVFDGHSVVIDEDGEVIARAPQFEEALVVCTLDPGAVASERLRDARHRAAVRRERERGGGPAVTVAELSVPRPGERTELGGPVADLLAPEAEVF